MFFCLSMESDNAALPGYLFVWRVADKSLVHSSRPLPLLNTLGGTEVGGVSVTTSSVFRVSMDPSGRVLALPGDKGVQLMYHDGWTGVGILRMC